MEPTFGFRFQVTAVLLAQPATVAENCLVWPPNRDVVVGLSVTDTGGLTEITPDAVADVENLAPSLAAATMLRT